MSSNLSKSTSMVRKGVIGFVIFAIVVLLLQFIMNTLTGEETDPGPSVVSRSAYESESLAFSKLPKPQVDSLTLAPNTRAIFSLSNNQRLPEFPPVVRVYEIQPLAEKLGDADRARQTAVELGFAAKESRLIDDTLYWEIDGLTRSLTYHKVQKEWNYEVDLAKDPATAENIELSEDTEFYQELNYRLLASLKIDTEYFSDGIAKVDFININLADVYTTAEVKDDARYVRVALFKSLRAATLKDSYRPSSNDDVIYDDLDAVVRKFDYISGPANIVVQGEVKDPDTDYVRFDYKDYDYGDFGVYPAITAEQAWDNIQANMGYLIWLRPQDKDQFEEYDQLSVSEFIADVDRTQIVYIEPDNRIASEEWTHYLQPYYMFEGVANLTDGRKAEFVFIIEAVNPNQFK